MMGLATRVEVFFDGMVSMHLQTGITKGDWDVGFSRNPH